MAQGVSTRQTVTSDAASGVRVYVHVGGEVDLGSAAAMQAALDRAITVSAVSTVVVDLDAVSFLESTGIGTLLAAHQHAADRGVALTVENAHGIVHRVLDLAGVLTVLTGQTRPAGGVAGD